MKITWYSNAPWCPTGYGQQTALTVPKIAADGHDVWIAANHGLQGTATGWNGIPVMPAGLDQYSNDIAPAHHSAHLGRDDGWLITLYDTWVLRPDQFDTFNLASWAPVDHYPVPPLVAKWCSSHPTIAMSRFGERALSESGIASTYIPHAISLEDFRPTEDIDGRSFRDIIGVPQDAFLVAINANNQGVQPPRKAWSEMFGAASVLMTKHRDVFLYVHAGQMGAPGVTLPVLAQAWGIPTDRLRFVSAYDYRAGRLPPSYLAAMYTASDVLLATSMGEGFGIPVIEAQACGLPVIVSDATAQPELVGGGWLARVQPEWNEGMASFLFRPIVSDIASKLEQAYGARGDTSIRRLAIEKAAEYDIERIYPLHWRPFLSTLESKFDQRPRAQRRAERRKKR